MSKLKLALISFGVVAVLFVVLMVVQFNGIRQNVNDNLQTIQANPRYATPTPSG